MSLAVSGGQVVEQRAALVAHAFAYRSARACHAAITLSAFAGSYSGRS